MERFSKFESSLERLFDLVEETREFSFDDSPFMYELKSDQNRYSESELIALGGMKTISKVFDRKTGRYVAMAKLHKDTPFELFEPFLREARLTALLDHPNIISIFDIGVDADSRPFFTMELKTGKGLDALIRKRRGGAELLNGLLEIFLKICDGVSYAHSHKVLHLDLKPENIQVGRYGEVTICDWGLGKLIGSPDYDGGELDRMLLNPDLLNNMTRADELRGTPGFMSPEQVAKKRVYKQSDIYALGAILYAILTGCAPLEGDVESVLKRTRKGEIIPPKRCNSRCRVPAALSAVAMKALATDPKDRYRTAASLRREVYSFISGYSTIAQKAGFITELSLFYKRNRTVSLVLFYAVLFIGALTMFFVEGLKESKLEAEFNQREAVKEKERAERILELYQIQKRSLSSFVEQNFSKLKEEVYEFTDSRILENPLLWSQRAVNYLDQMVNSDPQSLWVYERRGYIQFIMQNFHKALENFKRIPEKFAHLEFFSKKYMSGPKTTNGLLEVDTLVKLFDEMAEFDELAGKLVLMMLYDGAVRKSTFAHSRVVKKVLRIFNPQAKDIEFKFYRNSKKLAVSGKGVFRFKVNSTEFNVVKKKVAVEIPLLQTLDLNSLSLRGSDIYTLQELQGLGLKRLDIRNTLINSCTDIETYLPGLRHLIAEKGQLKADDPVFSNPIIQVELH